MPTQKGANSYTLKVTKNTEYFTVILSVPGTTKASY